MNRKLLLPAVLAAFSIAVLPSYVLADSNLDIHVVESRQVDDVRWFDGIVEATNQSTVSSQTSARIIGLDFDVNDFVNEGDVIVRFSDAEHKTRLSQTEANLQAAIATSKGAGEEFKRVERLLASGTVAKARFDGAKATFDAAKAQERTAMAAVEQSREQLGYTIVRAPYSGLVIARHVQIGEIANLGQPLMTGFSLEKLRVSVAVPQQYAGLIRRSNSATIIGDQGIRIESDKLTVFPFADERSNTVTVRADLPAGTTSVFPGMLVKAAFVVGVTDVLTVPEQALVKRGEVIGVYLVNDKGNVQLQQIRSGHSEVGGDVEVWSGLSAGDRIASDPIAATMVIKSQSDASR